MNERLRKRKKLLIDTLSIQSSSGKEHDMIAYITDFCKINVPTAEVVVDNNNIYITKGDTEFYPCIVSHTDTVHNIHKYYKVFNDDGCIFAFNAQTGKQVGVGGDDKVGIWIALEMLLSQENIKCAFFHSEEIGCIGSSQANMKWFNDVGYCFQADRRGNTDFVNSISGKLYSKAFKKAIAPILKEYGYKEASGSMTDVLQLSENSVGVCVANMSCGYWEPHSDEEIVEFDDANNCLDMVVSLVHRLGCNKYGFQYENRYKALRSYNDWYGANSSYGGYGNYGYETQEVIVDADTGGEACYYCGNSDLSESSFGDDFRFCEKCSSDVYMGDFYEQKNPNQIEIEYEDDEVDYNNSWSSVKEDVSDNYDDKSKDPKSLKKILSVKETKDWVYSSYNDNPIKTI